ncbi:MAG: phosphoglycerate dehydrogenase [Nitrospinota bacterium]|nr:phosphoglycerate dehydrogenase [Nitrospinota bacterium]
MANKFKVLVSDDLSDAGLDILRSSGSIDLDVKVGLKPDELKKIISAYNGIVIRSATKLKADILEAATNLKVVARAGAGVDNVDIPFASRKGIAVENTPGGNTVTTGEHSFALLISMARNIPQGTSGIKNGEWNRKLIGVELMGKTLGLVGLGRVGSVVVSCAIGFKMRCLAFDPFISKEKAAELGVELVDLEDIWKESDFISVHTPLTEKTKHMISAAEFGKMKKGVRIVNCARGGIINEDALCDALDSGQVAGAALDVFEKEPPDKESRLVKHPNVICTPHLGASTEEAQENVALAAARQMVAYAETGAILNAVNVPAVDPETLKRVQPYLTLAEKMGSLLAQITDEGVKEIEIASSGEIADVDQKPLINSVLKGFLSVILGEEVNYVSAPFFAEERGIVVKTSASHTAHDFIGLFYVKVVTDGGEQAISGTLFGHKESRIVNINGVYIEAIPEGNILAFTNIDKPGVIGAIGAYLGKKGINIGQFRLGRTAPLAKAMSLVNIDSPLTQEDIEEIKKLEHIENAWMIKL